MDLGGMVLLFLQGICIIIILIFGVMACVFFYLSRQPVEPWAFEPDRFMTGIAADERERPGTMFTCGVLAVGVGIVFVIIGIVVF